MDEMVNFEEQLYRDIVDRALKGNDSRCSSLGTVRGLRFACCLRATWPVVFFGGVAGLRNGFRATAHRAIVLLLGGSGKGNQERAIQRARERL